MLRVCLKCGRQFDDRAVVILGKERHLWGRQHCLACRPFAPHRAPSVRVQRPPKQLTCDNCCRSFSAKIVVDGKIRSLYRRKFCLDCSPFGIHNSSKTPPGNLSGNALAEHRRKRRNAKTYRYQKRKRRELKITLIEMRGGRCTDCGYSALPAALEFHHRDPATKDFSISSFSGPIDRLMSEFEKCDLVCANCHRLRHLREDPPVLRQEIAGERRRRKERAVALMGNACDGCGWKGPLTVFEFHHRSAAEKEFGISEDGIMRRWEKVVAELAKCVMLCANCHREVHAGVRTIDDGPLGLAEPTLAYIA